MPAARKTSTPKEESGTGLVVTAPLVQVQISRQVLHLFVGDAVPEGVSKEQLDHLKDLGYIASGDVTGASDSE